jgi:phosphatidate cytidylyltransferase
MSNGLQPHELTGEQKVSLKARVITGIILAIIGIPCIFLGGWFYFAVVMALLAIGTHEILVAPQKRFPLFIYIFTYVLIFSFVYWIFIKNNIASYIADKDLYIENFNKIGPDSILFVGFNDIIVSSIGVAVAVCVFFFVSFLVTDFTINDICYFFTMSILIGLGFQSFYFLRYYPNFLFDKANVEAGYELVHLLDPSFKYAQSAFLICYVVLGTICNDIGAYFVGILFGKNKVNPRISPKKTWEGVVGGVIFSMIVSVTFALLCAYFNMPLLPTLTLDGWYWILIISALIVFLSILGDFAFSAIKRFFAIKDFGSLLKGHGGVLDRFDSLIFSGIGVSVILIFITNGWDFFK